jgi:hypothetical protein
MSNDNTIVIKEKIVLDVREQIMEDIDCYLDGLDVELIADVQNIVIENFKTLLEAK